MEAGKAEKSALEDASGLLERFAVTNREAQQLLFDAFAGSSQMAGATTELRWGRDTNSTPGKRLARIANLRSSMKSLGDEVSLYETSEEELKNATVAAIKDSTRLNQ